MHRTTVSRLPAALVAAAAALACPAMGAEFRFGVGAEYSHENNVNRAALEKEKRDDDAVSLEAYAARSVLLSARSGLVFKAALRATEYFDFSDLSNLTATGRVAWRVQPTPGYTSPWIEIAGQVDGFRYRDSELRDGYAGSVTASVGKYFTDRIRAEAGAGLDRRGGGSANVYDLSNRKVWAALDYKIAQPATLYGSATWIGGEQVFTLFNTTAWGPLYASAKASAPDTVFASAFAAAPNAYRVDASAWRYELGMNIALGGSHALDLGWSRFDARADSGYGKYDGDLFRVGYLYRFQ